MPFNFSGIDLENFDFSTLGIGAFNPAVGELPLVANIENIDEREQFEAPVVDFVAPAPVAISSPPVRIAPKEYEFTPLAVTDAAQGDLMAAGAAATSRLASFSSVDPVVAGLSVVVVLALIFKR